VPPDAERWLAVEGPYDFDESLRFVPFGRYDPACRRGPGRLWRAGRTPDGPVTLQLCRTPGGVAARAWGPGAAWALDRVPALAGVLDDPAGFAPPPVRSPRSRGAGEGSASRGARGSSKASRSTCCSSASPSATPPGLTAGSWRRSPPRRRGRPASGSRSRPPTGCAWATPTCGGPASTAGAPTPCGRRARRPAGGLGLRPRRRGGAPPPRVGPWLRAVDGRDHDGLRARRPGCGAPGDLHLPHQVGGALAAEPRADDARMLTLLQPFRGIASACCACSSPPAASTSAVRRLLLDQPVGAWRSRKRRCRRSTVGCTFVVARTSARVAKPPPLPGGGGRPRRGSRGTS